ncbi:hypothetical protein TorRG33x02_128820 [Trema orientale]|uniref:Extracellular ligand-gated ion channel n=1 Tax=Trema orientale TaxID=63057 RepID=A0A2P5F0L5_TREOI|nr:hypothetical protein TorRG33x02_128820 [Trema orientale]
MEDERLGLLSKPRIRGGVELMSFGSFLKWVCVDQSSLWRVGLSWSVFVVFAIGVPVASHFLLACPSCDPDHSRPYHVPAQISLSLYATLSFVCLSRWSRKYGLRRFLFIDKLCESSEKVRHGYEQLVQESLKFLVFIILVYSAAESVYKIWWYVSGASEIPYIGNLYLSLTIFCMLELFSWLYRITIIFLVCVLFRLICYLQILRLEDFARVFQKETEVGSILIEHLGIRRNLRTISHRYRLFILLSLILVTASQLIALLMTTRSNANVNVFKAGELALCSISIVTGLFICLRSATKVSHKAQSLTGLAAKWHVCATINSFDSVDNETPTTATAQVSSMQVFPVGSESDSEDESGDGDDDDDLNDTKLVPIFTHTISFQKRQALVTYLENNKAGITVFGFMLDRTWLHSIFGIQLALLLWLLNKTIGIS